MKFITESVALILVTLTQVHVKGYDLQPAVSCPNECILLLCETRNPKIYAAQRYTSRCGTCWSTVLSSSSRYSSQSSMKMYVTSKCQRSCVLDLIEMSSGNTGLYRKDLTSCGSCWSSIYHSSENTQLISVTKMKIIIEGLMKRFPVQDRYSGGSSDNEIFINTPEKKNNGVLIEIDTGDKDRQQTIGDNEHGNYQGHGVGVAHIEHESLLFHSAGGGNNINQGNNGLISAGIGVGISGHHSQSQQILEHANVGTNSIHGSSSIYGIGGTQQTGHLEHNAIQGSSSHTIIGGIHASAGVHSVNGGHMGSSVYGIHSAGIQGHISSNHVIQGNIGHNAYQAHGIIGGIHQEEEHVLEHGIYESNNNVIDHSKEERQKAQLEVESHQEEHESHQEENESHQEEHVTEQVEHGVEQEEQESEQEGVSGVGIHGVIEQEHIKEELETDSHIAESENVEEGIDESIGGGESEQHCGGSSGSHHKVEVNHSISTQDVVCFCKIKNVPGQISATIINENYFHNFEYGSTKWNPLYSYESPNYPFFKTSPFDYVYSATIGKISNFGSTLISELFKYKKALLKVFGKSLFSKLTGSIKREVKLVLEGFNVLEPLKTCGSTPQNSEYSYVLRGCIVKISRCVVDDIHNMVNDLLLAYSKLSPGSSFSGGATFISSFEKRIFSCGNKHFASKIRGKNIKCGLSKLFEF
ncbi:uncharacterized protein LOC123319216 [Coccinella septempunctata]|uniref:uncharacterized protein LOC123319216 n=1 Tax=Coccinella septempunctata TaxID=41139 RepID=UPI001D097610|nr:uncharacterized protein LOC123319216 [Coccinella septempunctata]